MRSKDFLNGRGRFDVRISPKILGFPTSVVLVILCGCARDYRHEVANGTSADMNHVTVSCDQDSFTHGVLIPGASKGYIGPLKLPGGSEATLSWEAEGTNISHTVVLPADAHKYRIVFQLKETGVKVELHDPF